MHSIYHTVQMHKHISDTIKAVLFDHDDTLVGTIEPKWAQHKYIAERYYGKKLTNDEIIQHWGKPLNELLGLLYGTKAIDEAIAHTLIHHEQYPKLLFPDTIPTIRHLHAAGMRIGIITATNRFSFEHDLTAHQMPRDCIDYTQTAEDTPYHKPDARVFDRTIEWLRTQKITPSEVVYVGDGLHDMKAAIGAGFSFLGVETGLVTAEQFTAAEAKSIPDISHLMH